jgi:SAM-dependent methyltransferase
MMNSADVGSHGRLASSAGGFAAGWWDEAFRAAYLEVYSHRSDAQAATEVAGLLPRLRLAPGPVVDAACGAGRHIAALRAAGVQAVGFDLSADLLAAARLRPACVGRLSRGDLRAPPFAGGCGAVLCLFTAFGYFDELGNLACLTSLGGLLAPGGWLLLDLPDAALVRRSLVADSERTTPGGWLVREQRRLTGARVEKDVEAVPPGGQAVRWRESVRLHEAGELRAMAAAAGLVWEDAWPGLGGPRDPQGRMVVWLRRPGADAGSPR